MQYAQTIQQYYHKMKNSLLWINPSITCLGDRLLDTMLLATYAKFLDADLHFQWEPCPFTIGGGANPTYSYKTGVNKTWDAVRFEDYKFENFTKYFTLPNNVKINEQVITPTHLFDAILGGCVSPALFYETHMKHMCSIDIFNNLFNETLSEFRPTDKLLNLVSDQPKPKLTVHLRRTDKINIRGDYNSFMTYEGLDALNDMTKTAIDMVYKDNDLIYFSSDDIEEREKYQAMYPNHIKHITNCLDIEKTYIDLYILSISDYIILSQVHSNFSVFASFINGAKLIYLYDKCMITAQGFNKSNNFIHYKEL